MEFFVGSKQYMFMGKSIVYIHTYKRSSKNSYLVKFHSVDECIEYCAIFQEETPFFRSKVYVWCIHITYVCTVNYPKYPVIKRGILPIFTE